MNVAFAAVANPVKTVPALNGADDRRHICGCTRKKYLPTLSPLSPLTPGTSSEIAQNYRTLSCPSSRVPVNARNTPHGTSSPGLGMYHAKPFLD